MGQELTQPPNVKDDLHRLLQRSRSSLLAKLEGLSEYDLRRPMTPTGTNLLGLVKHLAGVEYVYFGDSFGRPPAESMSWVDDDSIWQGADMWATADESSDYIIGLYQRAREHADQTIDALEIDSPGTVPHWRPETRHTTLGFLLTYMLAETAQHAGHVDIIRELIDGRGGAQQDDMSPAEWDAYLGQIQAAADAFR